MVEQGVEAERGLIDRRVHAGQVEGVNEGEDLLGAEWDRPYSREDAAYPVASLRTDKYWVPVSRIDNAYGDRHVVCPSPPIEDYAG